MTDNCPVFSLVLPAYNEAANIEAVTARLKTVANELDGPVEVVWVNDGSTDETAEILEKLANQDELIRPLHLSRNFGHMSALTAGLEHARARKAVITLDADGQHPPELIPAMVEKWRQGADIVQMLRTHTPDEGTLKRLTSRGFYWLMNLLGNTKIPEGAADFRLLDRSVVDALNSLPERVRFLRGLVYWIGFDTATITYEADRRIAGKTKYGLLRMVALALSGITSFSTRPLRIAFFFGALISGIALLYGAWILYCFITNQPLVPGWTSTLLAILVLSGVQLLSIGIIGEYLALLFTEQKNRPVYIVRAVKTRDKNENR